MEIKNEGLIFTNVKIADLKKGMLTPSFPLLYSYCMDGAIGFRYAYRGAMMFEINLWPELMVFSFERLDVIKRQRFHGRITRYITKDTGVIYYDVDDDNSPLSVFEREGLTLGLFYLLGYLKCKPFNYEKKYEDPFRQ